MATITIDCSKHGESPAILLDGSYGCKRCHDEHMEYIQEHTAPEPEKVECPGCRYWRSEAKRLEKLVLGMSQ